MLWCYKILEFSWVYWFFFCDHTVETLSSRLPVYCEHSHVWRGRGLWFFSTCLEKLNIFFSFFVLILCLSFLLILCLCFLLILCIIFLLVVLILCICFLFVCSDFVRKFSPCFVLMFFWFLFHLYVIYMWCYFICILFILYVNCMLFHL